MKSSGKIFGVIFAGCLMFAASGCLVMDPADEAEFDQPAWAEELLDDAAEWGEQAGGDHDFQVLDGGGDDFPDPFGTGGPGDEEGGGSGDGSGSGAGD